MNIQIGMRCEPDWLCGSIGWVLVFIAIAVFVGLLKIIKRELGQKNGPRYKIKLRRDRKSKK